MSKKEAKKIEIAQLNPTTPRGLSLIFEVVEVLSRSDNQQKVWCRVVDQSGVITACFDEYGQFIKAGSVIELQSFKCQVVDHHLLLTLRYIID